MRDIKVLIEPSIIPYWKAYGNVLPFIEIYKGYKGNGNDLMILTANPFKIIGIGYADDVGEDYEIPDTIQHLNLADITKVELEFLFQFYFDGCKFTPEVLTYLKSKNPSLYSQYI
jgi:hypothetical protein